MRLARRQVLREKVSDSGQGFITGNEFDFSRLYLRDTPSHLGKLFGSDVWRNILRQAFYQSLREFGPSIRRQSHRITKDFFGRCHGERLLGGCGLRQAELLNQRRRRGMSVAPARRSRTQKETKPALAGDTPLPANLRLRVSHPVTMWLCQLN